MNIKDFFRLNKLKSFLIILFTLISIILVWIFSFHAWPIYFIMNDFYFGLLLLLVIYYFIFSFIFYSS